MFARSMLVLMLVGLVCFAAFGLIGSHVDPDGVLGEPFFLLPIGYLLLSAGLAGLAALGLARMLRRAASGRRS